MLTHAARRFLIRTRWCRLYGRRFTATTAWTIELANRFEEPCGVDLFLLANEFIANVRGCIDQRGGNFTLGELSILSKGVCNCESFVVMPIVGRGIQLSATQRLQ